MKNKLLVAAILFVLSLTACVQKTFKRIVVVKLAIENKTDIKTVGIRGNDKPLNWDTDYLMQELIKDSLYTANVTVETGYKFTELKFTVNGALELNDQPNRRINFSDGDTTYFTATFNK